MARSRHRLDARAVRHKKNKHYHPLPKALACMVAACFAADAALANPIGPTVVNGQVSFSASGDRLSIVNTPGSIINWQSFSIGVGELTRFIQQSASSTVLNRVVGVDPSQILGALQSNGRVFLINPNGILFGAGSRINVGALVASTLNLSNADFLNGKLNFTATSGAGSVINQGAITTPSGGQVYLIAPDVQNSGIIQSPQGEVVLAAGHSVELVDADTPDLRVEVTASDEQAVNLGEIVADSGKIGIYAGLIKNNGTLQANTVVAGQNGQILLVATNSVVTGANSKITATGQAPGTTGGTVEVTGNSVDLAGGSTIDVSGQSGGGTILVGGGEHGADPNLPDAQNTTVESDANLIADATNNGAGGDIIVWSNGTTQFDGSISARGGANGGNGGFSEISGNTLLFNGNVDLSASNGKDGTLLFDPSDVTIGNTCVDDNCTFTWATLNELGAEEAVNVEAEGESDTGNISIYDDNSSDPYSQTNPLSLFAVNNINILSPTEVYVTNGATLNMYAGWNVASGTSSPTVNTGVGSINFDGFISTNGPINLIAGYSVAFSGTTGDLYSTATDPDPGFDSGRYAVLVAAAGAGGITTSSGVFGITATNGSIGLQANEVTLSSAGLQPGGYTVNGANVAIWPWTYEPISIGTTTSGQLSLLQSDFNAIAVGSGGQLYIGDYLLAQNITVNAPIDFSAFSDANVILDAGDGSITQVAGATVTATSLALVAGYNGDDPTFGNVSMPENNQVSTLAGSANNGSFIFSDVTPLTVGSVGPFSGITVSNSTPGGSANITITAPSITVTAPIDAYAEDGGEGLAGGSANIALTASNGILIQSSVYAAAGDGGNNEDGGDGGAGGAASITLTGGASGITINSNGYVQANGGQGGDGGEGNGGVGGSASIALNGGTGGIVVDTNGSITAAGGDGGDGNANGGAGGLGSVSLITTGNIAVQGNGEIYAYGGEGGYGNNEGGSGGDAQVTIGDGTNSGITINSGYVYADGGEGGESGNGVGGTGGAGIVTLDAGGSGILIENGTSPASVRADGGEGGYGDDSALGGDGGAASITLTGPGVVINTGASIFAEGGNGNEGGEGGGSGGTAAIVLNAGTGGIEISSPNSAEAEGGEGGSGYDVGLGGNGGSASFSLTASGAISLDNTELDVQGGEGNDGSGGSGGDSSIAFNAGGALSLNDSTAVSAYGGEGNISDGNAHVIMNAQGPIDISDSSSVDANSSEGNATISVTSATGNINVTDSSITAEDEGGNDFIGMLAGGDIDIFDSSVLSYGSIAVAAKSLNVTADDDTSMLEAAGGNLAAVVDNINVTGGSNSSTPAFIGGYSGVSLFLGSTTSQIQLTAGTGEDSYAQIVTAVPGTIDVTYLARTSGGYSVDGQSGVVTDAATETGFYTSPDLVEFTPAVLGDSLFVNYLGSSTFPSNGSEIPLAVTASLDFIFGEINDPYQGEETKGNKKGSGEDNNKNSCS